MRYFVVAPDGTQFGPADLPTLRQWASEGRIAPETVLVAEGTGTRTPARSIPGLLPMEAPGYAARPPEQPSVRGGGGGHEVAMSYLCSAMSMICCGLFVIGGFVYANRAIAKGNRGGLPAKAVAWLFLMLWIATSILMVVFYPALKDWLVQTLRFEMP